MAFYRNDPRYWLRALVWTNAAALVAALCLVVVAGDAGAANLQRLEIATKSGPRAFLVEMATTEDEKNIGLMNRSELPDGRGMLFDFAPPQLVSMWMKNTLIPLDMIFIQADGHILRVAQNIEPLSTVAIPSGGLVKGVLEVTGGTVKKYGIGAGDRVEHPLFAGDH
jgi:uncharacterized membrane protein (UPF0127 family)